ncbi:MAG: hypothetical protein QW589_02040 [Candidatus Bathyarchaeia archaeon]
MKSSIKAKTIKRLLFLVSTIFLIALLISPVQAASIVEYTIPTSNSGPIGIAIDSTNEIILFTEFKGDKIGKLNMATGAIEEYSLLDGTRPFDIAFDGSNVWFTERYGNDKIGRLDSSGIVHEYKLPTDYSWSNLWGIIVDPEDNVWFASNARNFIGKFDKTTISIFTIPTPNSGPKHLVYDPRGPFIWFTMAVANKIGRLNPLAAEGKGEIVEYSLPATLNAPDHIAIDSFGFIWFTCEGSNTIGKLNPWTGEFTTIYTSGISRGIAIDSNNNVWFTLVGLGKIARYSPSLNLITEFSIPTSPSSPEEVLIQESSPITVWFTEYDGNKIGKLTPGAPFSISTVTVLPTVSSTTGISSTTTSSTLSTTLSTTSTSFVPASSLTIIAPSATSFSELAYSLQVTTTATVTSTKTITTTTITSATSTSYIATVSDTTTATLTVYSPTVTVTSTTSTTETATSTTYVTTITDTYTTTSWTTIPTTTTTTQTSTTTSWITTTATTTTTPAMPTPIIPGFPIESIIAGLASGALALSMLRRIKKH